MNNIIDIKCYLQIINRLEKRTYVVYERYTFPNFLKQQSLQVYISKCGKVKNKMVKRKLTDED